MKQTDFVISQYAKPVHRMCSLDVVTMVAYLAFMDPEKARSMKFTIEYILAERNKEERLQEEAELVSQITEEESYIESESDMISVGSDELLTPSSSKSFAKLQQKSAIN